MAAALELHDELIARTVEAHADGCSSQGRGRRDVDGVPARLRRVAAAVELQQALARAFGPVG